MKYAIIESGGKQYRAIEGSTIEVDLLESAEGDKISLPGVLLYVDGDTIQVGTPTVSGATISATVIGTVKGPKVTVFKYRPKKRYRVKTGHRAKYTKLMIDSIALE